MCFAISLNGNIFRILFICDLISCRQIAGIGVFLLLRQVMIYLRKLSQIRDASN